ncbi:MAG: acyl--CoA ligase [Lachnospiraceae bacterium]|nr:acyl--CoA ligase [Lachnospiraceae bacterium]
MSRTYDDTMFIDTFEHNYTWLNGFMRNVRRYPERTALIDPVLDLTLNYKDLNVKANQLAHALRDDGVVKDDVVMTALRNCPAFIYSYVGPRKIGAIVQPANYNLAPGELQLLIDFNRPKVFIYSANVRDAVAKAVNNCKWKPIRMVMADNLEGIELPEGHISYEDYTDNQEKTDPKMDFRPHIYDEVLRLCTSGTTALPKSVPINDINEVLSAHDYIMQCPLNIFDRCMNMTPWFHRGGVHIVGPCPCLYVGCSIVVMREFNPSKVLSWVEKYGITFIIGAPSTLEILSRSQLRHPSDLSSLKGLYTMGAPFEKAACEKYMETLTPNIFNGYGTTETLVNLQLRPYDLPDGAGSVGRSCIDDDVRVVRVYDDKKAEPDELIEKDDITQGEVIIQSPAKSTYCYYHNPELTEEKFYKGWMYTGDMATWNKDSIITISGRKDDMLVVSGENVYPSQIEEVLNEHPKVKDSLVTSVPDKVRGQVAVAYIIPEKEGVTVSELMDFCAHNKMLSVYKTPRYYCITDSIPHTATGKKMHHLMKKRALDDLKTGKLKRK